MPLDASQRRFKSCCGKGICHGCIYAMKMSEGKDLCPFCRTPPPSPDEDIHQKTINQIKKLMDKGNAEAFNMLGSSYAEGKHGMPQDFQKANELWLKAAELGCSMAYYNLGQAYRLGRGVEMDMNKAKHYWEIAAMNGHIKARHNLGCTEGEAGNHRRAFRHYMISAKGGYDDSLDAVKQGFQFGFVLKDEYANTLRAYQKSNKEMKSDERDKAASEMRD